MDIERGVAEIIARYLQAYRTGDAAGCAACYLPDGAVHSPYAPPALGRQAIEDLHRDWTRDAAPNKTLDPREIGGEGATAWCLARFADDDAAGEGWSLNVLERQADGSWLIRISSLNAAD
jgi:uncharacterized protein (TIGR02246 family)